MSAATQLRDALFRPTNLHQRIVPKIVVVDRILVAAGDRRDARRHHLDHLVLDMVGIAAVQHRLREPRAHTSRSDSRSNSAPPLEDCFLRRTAGRSTKQRIVGHGGCGTGLIREATRWNNDLLRESAAFRQSPRKKFQASCIIRASLAARSIELTHREAQ